MVVRILVVRILVVRILVLVRILVVLISVSVRVVWYQSEFWYLFIFLWSEKLCFCSTAYLRIIPRIPLRCLSKKLSASPWNSPLKIALKSLTTGTNEFSSLLTYGGLRYICLWHQCDRVGISMVLQNDNESSRDSSFFYVILSQISEYALSRLCRNLEFTYSKFCKSSNKMKFLEHDNFYQLHRYIIYQSLAKSLYTDCYFVEGDRWIKT